MSDYKYKIPISKWAEEDQPREKLILKGKAALSDAELIGILIGSGNRDLSAVDLAKVIMNAVGNDLNALAKCTVSDLQKFNGIGEAKAIAIISALELGRRRKSTESVEKPILRVSHHIYDYMKPMLLDLTHEEFWVIFLNQSSKVIKHECLSAGGISETVIDVRLVMKQGLEVLATSIILVHNHPSGNIKPSHKDYLITQKLKEAGRIMDINVVEHLIFTDNGFYSFADKGEI